MQKLRHGGLLVVSKLNIRLAPPDQRRILRYPRTIDDADPNRDVIPTRQGPAPWERCRSNTPLKPDSAISWFAEKEADRCRWHLRNSIVFRGASASSGRWAFLRADPAYPLHNTL
jgi:hypothetical protein